MILMTGIRESESVFKLSFSFYFIKFSITKNIVDCGRLSSNQIKPLIETEKSDGKIMEKNSKLFSETKNCFENKL